MEPKNRTSYRMSMFGIELPNWNQVDNSDGTNAGSNERVEGGTQHYDSSGNPTYFVDDDDRIYDVNGDEVFDDVDLYDED